jgi:hypothetical protein
MDDSSDGGGDWQRCQHNNSNDASATRVLKPAQQLQRRQQQRQHKTGNKQPAQQKDERAD